MTYRVTKSDVYAIVTLEYHHSKVKYVDNNGRAVKLDDIDPNPLFEGVFMDASMLGDERHEIFILYCTLVVDMVPEIWVPSKKSFFASLGEAIDEVQTKEDLISDQIYTWSSTGYSELIRSPVDSACLHSWTSTNMVQNKDSAERAAYQDRKNTQLENKLKAMEGKVKNLQAQLNNALQTSKSLERNLKAAEEIIAELQAKLDV
jgi:hypothetical protein